MKINQDFFDETHSLGNLSLLLEKESPSSIFLVTGKKSFDVNAGRKIIQESIQAYPFFRFSHFSVNPKIEEVAKGAALLQKEKSTLILAVGGGSVLDMAKLISLASFQPFDNLKKMLEGNLPTATRTIPLIALPTTTGSGSEATRFAVVYMEGRKYSLSEASLKPDAVILDPLLVSTLSPFLTAASGLDALAQAIESWWANSATVESDRWAKEAMILIHNNLFGAIDQQEKAREELQKGAFLAGKAIDLTRTTAPHALSYTLTSRYGVPHGFAVFLTVPTILKIHSQATEKNCRYPAGKEKFQKKLHSLAEILGFSSLKKLIESLESYDERIPELKKYRQNHLATKASWTFLLENSNTERMYNNPVLLQSGDFYA